MLPEHKTELEQHSCKSITMFSFFLEKHAMSKIHIATSLKLNFTCVFN